MMESNGIVNALGFVENQITDQYSEIENPESYDGILKSKFCKLLQIAEILSLIQLNMVDDGLQLVTHCVEF